MSSRFPQQRAQNSLFAGYDAQTNRTKSTSPAPGSHRPNGSYGLHPKKQDDNPPRASSNPAFGAYPGSSGVSQYNAGGYGYGGEAGSHMNEHSSGGYRSATPNSKGQYSDAVLRELEGQNDDQLEGMSAKVRMLKDLTTAIGDEIRDSSNLAEKMNESFENARARLKGTMNRMLRMAERSGVGWKAWVGFFAAVVLLFWYIWLF